MRTRNETMQLMYDKGSTLQEIACVYAITRQRVHQLIRTSPKIAVDRKRREIDRGLLGSPYWKEKRDWLAAEKFLARITEGPNGCRIWLGPCASERRAAYRGRLAKLAGKTYCEAGARIAWIIHNGPIPDGMWVLHKCDNPQCLNIDHLYLGTPKQNVRDREVRGRSNRDARFSLYEVQLIRKRAATGVSIAQIARDMAVTYVRVHGVVSGRTYGLS